MQLLRITEKQSWCAISYVIRKYIPIPDDEENSDAQIIHQSSIVINMFTRDLGKVLDILKELTLETDSKTWINVLKCVRKSIQ